MKHIDLKINNKQQKNKKKWSFTSPVIYQLELFCIENTVEMKTENFHSFKST